MFQLFTRFRHIHNNMKYYVVIIFVNVNGECWMEGKTMAEKARVYT